MSFNSRESSLADGSRCGCTSSAVEPSAGATTAATGTSPTRTRFSAPCRAASLTTGSSVPAIRSPDQFVITAPADLDVALLYKAKSPSNAIDLVVYDMHYGDVEAAVSWVGEIGDVDWPTVDSSRITCVSEDELMDQPGLIDTSCRTCTATWATTAAR
ncbi:hypothetical protein P4131_25550 [Pseudomonas aeruginosa]|nr:hypothetical protein [Pseudomonas aeruginosa]